MATRWLGRWRRTGDPARPESDRHSPRRKILLPPHLETLSGATIANHYKGSPSRSIRAVTEHISVTATATPVQTASGENSTLIDPAQMNNITLKGRDLFGLLVMLPGVQTAQQDTTSENSIGSVRINGGPYGGLA